MKFTITKINNMDCKITNDNNETAIIENFGQTIMTTTNNHGKTETWDITNDVRGYMFASISQEFIQYLDKFLYYEQTLIVDTVSSTANSTEINITGVDNSILHIYGYNETTGVLHDITDKEVYIINAEKLKNGITKDMTIQLLVPKIIY